jgi:hypothetical protein
MSKLGIYSNTRFQHISGKESLRKTMNGNAETHLPPPSGRATPATRAVRLIREPSMN